MAAVLHRAISPSAEEADIIAAMRAEGLSPYRWSNGPYESYPPHRHAYHKILYCARGSIRFVLTRDDQALELRPGDRLEIEPHTEHSAFVGPDGVVCLEAQR